MVIKIEREKVNVVVFSVVRNEDVPEADERREEKEYQIYREREEGSGRERETGRVLEGSVGVVLLWDKTGERKGTGVSSFKKNGLGEREREVVEGRRLRRLLTPSYSSYIAVMIRGPFFFCFSIFGPSLYLCGFCTVPS